MNKPLLFYNDQEWTDWYDNCISIEHQTIYERTNEWPVQIREWVYDENGDAHLVRHITDTDEVKEIISKFPRHGEYETFTEELEKEWKE